MKTYENYEHAEKQNTYTNKGNDENDKKIK